MRQGCCLVDVSPDGGFFSISDRFLLAWKQGLVLRISFAREESKIVKKENFKRGAKDGIPIALGYFAGLLYLWNDGGGRGLKYRPGSFNLPYESDIGGAVCRSGYYSRRERSCWEMALTQLIINLRYCLMSFSLSQKFEKNMKNRHRFVTAFGVTDEIFGISASQKGRISPYYNYGAMCVAIPGWTLGTLAGAISGNLLPDFMMSALSVVIYGMFMAIIIPPSKTNRAILAVVTGAMAFSGLFSVLPF